MSTSTRSQDIKAIHQKYDYFYKILGGLGLVIIGIWIGTLLFTNGYWIHVYTEFLSVIITIVTIDQLQRYRAKRECQQTLFRNIKSHSNDVSRDALSQIQNEGLWGDMLDYYRDEDGCVQLNHMNWIEATLPQIHLEKVILKSAHLERANLREAHLENANLDKAHLNHADLGKVHLAHANLHDACLDNANLGHAHLEHANLTVAHLEHAFLWGTNLEHATLYQARLNHADLMRARLNNADLRYVHMKHACLRGVQFNNTKLFKARLDHAEMIHAHLTNAYLVHARLDHANLYQAQLMNADLTKSHFEGANLFQANLRDAKYIDTAYFNEETVLPDSLIMTDENDEVMRDENDNLIYDKYWTPDIDMTRYTDPTHPDFWEPIYFINTQKDLDMLKQYREQNK